MAAAVLKRILTPRMRSYRVLFVFGLLAVTIWLSRYSGFSSFGLYFDDVTRIPDAVEYPLELNARMLAYGLLHPQVSGGRPLHAGAIRLLSWSGNQLGGLPAMYMLGFLIVTANACLFYLLLRRMRAPEPVALPAALAYALFPADTTQTWLTLVYGAQPSITALLLAFHCYLSRLYVPAYLLSVLPLWQYETVFSVFLAAPLMSGRWGRMRLAEWRRHVLVVGSTLAAVVLLRRYLGESRVSELDLVTAVTWPLHQMAVGPLAAFQAYFQASWSALRTMSAGRIPLVLTCLAVFFLLLYRIRIPALTGPRGQAHLRRLGWLSAAGLACLILAYPLAFTIRMGALREAIFQSRVHLPAVLGASLLFGCLCSLTLAALSAIRMKAAAAGVFALLLAGLVSYGNDLQRDYKLAWQYERAFWTDVIRLCPDLHAQSVILYDRSTLPTTEHIRSFSWNTTLVPARLYRLEPEAEPIAVPLAPDWRNILSRTGDIRQAIVLGPMAEERFRKIEKPDYIYIEVENGRLVRRGGVPYSRPPQTRRWLYHLLMLPPDEQPANYLQ